MESVYEICFYGGLILAILLLIAAILLFILLKIPRVFGELTGRTAKKGIQDLKKGVSTDHSVAKKEQAKYYNQGTGKIKARETVSEKTRKENQDDTTDLLRPETDTDETEVLGAGKYKNAGKFRDGDETEVLGAETNVEDEATDVLVSGGGGTDDTTDVLTSDDGADDATEVLAAEEEDDATDDATEVLTAEPEDDATDDATEVLTAEPEDDATDVLTSDMDDDATDVLRAEPDDDEESTTVLTSDMTDELSRKVKVSYNIVITHTDETL